jgi:hypothetical protein
MAPRPPATPDDFLHIKSEPLRFVLYVVRDVRYIIEAAMASKWLWLCIGSIGGIGGSATWLISKMHG